MILFLDTETTGLPHRRSASSYLLSNWPRLVEIAWIECNENGTVESEYDQIIKPESFEIPRSASAVHGITTEKAISVGIPLTESLKIFYRSLQCSDLCVGHNIDFDVNVVNAKFIRTGFLLEHLRSLWKQTQCTMKSSTKLCRLKKGHGYYKYPKLSELHTKLFGKTYEDQHNALNDARACMSCYFELHRRGIL
ncbi:3'-5' exonuclease [uncultured Methanoregula sp.]|uniref:3'-5' exonuclease n=1 Tax=uncultured Methanoregula sp. TaxID=1005933 RepID=UPI002AAA8F13|nr:3'-5' exonuclease [uncultured Methanoregula sp.]